MGRSFFFPELCATLIQYFPSEPLYVFTEFILTQYLIFQAHAMRCCAYALPGEPGQKNGVKLEEMVRNTPTGYELVANFPFEDELLA